MQQFFPRKKIENLYQNHIITGSQLTVSASSTFSLLRNSSDEGSEGLNTPFIIPLMAELLLCILLFTIIVKYIWVTAWQNQQNDEPPAKTQISLHCPHKETLGP